jgi:Transposase
MPHLDVMSPGLKPVARPQFMPRKEGCSDGRSRASGIEGRALGRYSEVFAAFDTAKLKHAVAVAEGGRQGEVRFLGEVENRPATSERLVKKVAGRYGKLQVCFEVGPTGYRLYRRAQAQAQAEALGYGCIVVAPALIPKRAGERVKTNRRDAIALARLLRAGELTAVWVPDVREAVRDLVRGRATAAEDIRRKRQQLSFLLRHDRIFTGGGTGPVPIGAGWLRRASIIPRSRSCSREDDPISWALRKGLSVPKCLI